MSISREHVLQTGFDIMFYAVRAHSSFKVSDITKDVTGSSPRYVQRYLKSMIDLGYIEKEGCSKYKATNFAKEMCGVAI